MRKLGKVFLSALVAVLIFAIILAASALLVAVLLGLIICVSALLSFIWAGFTPNFVAMMVATGFILWAFYPVGEAIITNALEK